MNKRVNAPRAEAGFTIIEVIIAMVILLIGVLATTTMLNTANAETARNQSRNGATNLVRDIVEASRALPYDQVKPTKDPAGAVDNTLVTALQDMPPAAGSRSTFADSEPSQAGWQIARRNVTYTIELQACVVDDAKDGVADHGSPDADGFGYFCPNLPSSPTGDSNGDDYRRIKVKAAWTTNSCNACGTSNQTSSPRTLSVTQTSVIVNPTGGLGPPGIGPPTFDNVTDCHTARINQVFRGDAVAAVFTVSDPAGTRSEQTVPTSVNSTTGDKTFSFTYNLQPPDNTYQVDIQGINSDGQGGNPVTTFLYINCKQPDDPTGLTGGYDWRRCANYPVACAAGDSIVDLDWNASGDPDVIGYYVYRVNGSKADWESPSDGSPDTQVACVSRSKTSPDTTTLPGPLDFLEPFQPACYDTGIPSVLDLTPFPPLLSLLNGRSGDYWVRAVDMEPPNPENPTIAPTQARTTNLTNHSGKLHVQENELNLRPSTPVLALRNDNGLPCLSWTDSTDVNALGLSLSDIRYYRIYRGSSSVATATITVRDPDNTTASIQVPDVPYKNRIGRAQPNAGSTCDTNNPTRSWFKDTSAPSTGHYWVTAVDQDYLESFPSNEVTWSG